MYNKKKIRVLYHYMLGRTAGGSDTCLFLLLKYLDFDKFEPYLLYRDESFYLDELKIKGVKTIQIPERIKKDLHEKLKRNAVINNQLETKVSLNGKKETSKLQISFLTIIKDVLKRATHIVGYIKILYVNKIQIVHTNHYLTGDRPMILASLFLNRKVVSHNRGLYSPDSFDVLISKYVDQIICMSDFSKSVYVNNGVKENKCKTIYDGIDTSFYKPSSIENNKFTVSCIGRLEIWKGQHILIDAAEKIVKEIPDIEILLIGAGDFESELKHRVKNKGLEKNILFTGHITNVKDYIEKSSLIVHTSIVPEPFGMVIIEAMALEKVVIATNFGGPVEIIENGVDGILVPPENSEVLANEIIRLSKNTDLRNTLSKQARIKVLEKFDVVQYAKKIEKVYQQYL